MADLLDFPIPKNPEVARAMHAIILWMSEQQTLNAAVQASRTEFSTYIQVSSKQMKILEQEIALLQESLDAHSEELKSQKSALYKFIHTGDE